MFSTFKFCPCSAPGQLFYNQVRTRETQERNTKQTDQGGGAELKSAATQSDRATAKKLNLQIFRFQLPLLSLLVIKREN